MCESKCASASDDVLSSTFVLVTSFHLVSERLNQVTNVTDYQ